MIGVAIAVGGASFYGGMKYAESRGQRGEFSRANFQNLSSEDRQQRIREFGANVGGGLGSGQRGGSAEGFIVGEIISKDDKSVTIKLRDGGSKIVFFSGSTEITKSASGSMNDLVAGKNISVSGAVNSDGSITAQSIQFRPSN